MNPEIKKAWVEALRSGEYEQGKGTLCYVGDPDAPKYCCLGVLCELAAKDGVIENGINMDGNYRLFDGMDTLLPRSVINWAGLYQNDPFLKPGEVDGEDVETAAEYNDKGADFLQIADLIEETL